MEPMLTSSRDIFLYGMPLIVMLLVSMFKLDELLGAAKSREPNRSSVQSSRTYRHSMMSDPDGRPWTA